MKPALTAEEWGRLLISELGVALHPDGLHVPLWTNDNSIPVLDSAERHSVAALALYDQPFGFTREDVAQLHKAADAIDSEWGVEGSRGIEEHKPGQWLRELAERIEALLPASVQREVIEHDGCSG